MKLALLIISAALAGCASRRPCLVYDRVHQDFYTRQGWTTDRSKALAMPRAEAKALVTQHRVNEEGEYADTGRDYPEQVVPQ